MRTVKIREISQDMVDFLFMENSIYKNILYKKDFVYRACLESSLSFSDDGKIYYGYSTITIKKSKSNNYFFFRKDKGGFTIDEKKKISIWFKKPISSIFSDIIQILKILDIDWYNPIFNQFLTKTVLEKIISKKITNPIDLCKYILKSNKIDASPKILYNNIINKKISKHNILRCSKIAKNFNHYMEYLNRTNDVLSASILSDLEDQALILETKINYNWSAKRMKCEHDRLTSIIMKETLDHMSDATIQDLAKYDIYEEEGFKLLYNEKDVYEEAEHMKHCVYTNYWSQIKDKKYLVYRVNFEGERVTLGMNLKDKMITYSQANTYRNGRTSEKMSNKLSEFVIKINYDFFKINVQKTININQFNF